MANKEAEQEMKFEAFWSEVGKEKEKIKGKKITVLAAWEQDDQFSNKIAEKLKQLGAMVSVLNMDQAPYGNEFSYIDLIESTDVCLLIPPTSAPTDNKSQSQVLFLTVKRMANSYSHKIVMISPDKLQNEMLMLKHISDRVTIDETGAATSLASAISGIASINF